MKKRENLYVYIVLMVFPLVFLSYAVGMKYMQSKILPLIIGGIVFLLIATGIIRELLSKGESEKTTTEGKSDNEGKAGDSWSRYALVGTWALGFFAVIYLIGFTISIPLFLLAYLKAHGARWHTSIITAVLTGGFVYGLFVMLLKMNLYEGILFLMLR